MTEFADRAPPGLARLALAVPAAPFALTAFVSAGLVFMVEPMMARLVLPLLGGTAMVWNTSLAFFQAALLMGYVYAHLLQRLRRVGAQVAAHLAVLALAGLCLPLHVANLFGEPSSSAPALWLIGVLAVSIGAPFAALSATAPLVQAWHARAARGAGGREPYGLYAASNLGSLIALVAYPVLVEPNVRLHAQTGGWSAGYGAFIALIGVLGVMVWRAAGGTAPAPIAAAAPRGVWRERAVWLGLAAIPSSLMLGVTSYITTDLGSAPFLWVAPLALYLASFIVAFQDRPIIPPRAALAWQAASLVLCGLVFWAPAFLPGLAIHLTCFFLTALVCHQALVARRPPAERLTDFYIWMSLGGVVGGALNAFVAPVVFSTVLEYPAVLVLSCLARPWGAGPVKPWTWAAGAALLVCAGAAVALAAGSTPVGLAAASARLLLAVAALLAFALRGRAVMFLLAACVLVTASERVSDRRDGALNWRGFFGALSLSRGPVPGLGEVRVLWHGTTLHGAQSTLPAERCRPLVYYAPQTPIGQVFETARRRPGPLDIGAVGLGTGSVAAYTRPGDRLRFFEIDPLVVKVATNPAYFSYTTACARGTIAYTLGDARLTLAKQPPGQFDLLLIDAFSSDSVPAHLLTVEAMRMYLSKLAPDGVLVLHLSNAHLDLMRPAQAAALAAGGAGLAQQYRTSQFVWASSEDAVIVARSRAALASFLADPRWSRADGRGVRPWSDDYTDIFGALLRRTAERLGAGG